MNPASSTTIVNAADVTTPFTSILIPAIGAPWPSQRGIYAGIVRGTDGQPDYHLIAAPVESEIIDADWATAIEKATQPTEKFSDWSLPTRREARLLAINCPDSFRTDDWYWTSEQYADYSDYAWIQGFSDGDQYYNRKSNEYRARAVRRFSII